MGMTTVKPLKLNDPDFLKRIRTISADSHRVVLTDHAKKRMIVRAAVALERQEDGDLAVVVTVMN